LCKLRKLAIEARKLAKDKVNQSYKFILAWLVKIYKSHLIYQIFMHKNS